MKTQTYVSVIVALLTLLLITSPTSAGVNDGFIIVNADATSYISMTSSPELNTAIQGVADRFIVQYANGMKFYTMAPAPTDLQGLIDQVGTRFVFQYANANRYFAFAYPVNLIGDTAKPIISELTVTAANIVRWYTDEYATGEVQYGTQPGNYTKTVSDPHYYKLHQFQLEGLSPGVVYYYIVRSVDRSGNAVDSVENHFSLQRLIYLPLLRR